MLVSQLSSAPGVGLAAAHRTTPRHVTRMWRWRVPEADDLGINAVIP